MADKLVGYKVNATLVPFYRYLSPSTGKYRALDEVH